MTAQDLKNAILMLAMQGKLAPQDSCDESVSDLLQQIKAEKEQLSREGKIKKEKPLPFITEEEYPFDIPENWGWIRLGDFCSVYNGDSINATVKQEKYSKPCDGWSFIATKDVGFDHDINYENGVFIPYEEDTFKIASADSILLCMEGGSAGKKIGILDRDVCFGNKLCCFYPIKVFNKFLYFYLQSPSFISSFFSVMTGLIGGVGAAKLKNLIMPLPPLAEQERIVEKIEELMPLVEEYGKAEEQLTALNTEFPDKLRKSILQQAIQGKLTERDPHDEPASELLKRIRAEKEKLIKEGKIKKEKPSSPITEDEIPFEIPDTWSYSRLSELAIGQITYGIIKLGEEDENGIKVLRCSDVKPGWICSTGIRTVRKQLSDEYSRTILQGGEIVINVRGTLGGCAIVPKEYAGYNVAREVAVLPLSKQINTTFILFVLLSPTFDLYLSNNLRGVAYKGLNIELLSSFILPIPPLEEQKRIVEKVNELLDVCAELKGCYE